MEKAKTKIKKGDTVFVEYQMSMSSKILNGRICTVAKVVKHPKNGTVICLEEECDSWGGLFPTELTLVADNVIQFGREALRLRKNNSYLRTRKLLAEEILANNFLNMELMGTGIEHDLDVDYKRMMKRFSDHTHFNKITNS